MPWLLTHSGDALNTEQVQRLYADKAKVKAVIAGFPINVAVDLAPDVAQRMLRHIIDEVVQGFSVEVVGEEVRRLPQPALSQPVGSQPRRGRPRGRRRELRMALDWVALAHPPTRVEVRLPAVCAGHGQQYGDGDGLGVCLGVVPEDLFVGQCVGPLDLVAQQTTGRRLRPVPVGLFGRLLAQLLGEGQQGAVCGPEIIVGKLGGTSAHEDLQALPVTPLQRPVPRSMVDCGA